MMRFHPRLHKPCQADWQKWVNTAAMRGNLTQADLAAQQRPPCTSCQVFVVSPGSEPYGACMQGCTAGPARLSHHATPTCRIKDTRSFNFGMPKWHRPRCGTTLVEAVATKRKVGRTPLPAAYRWGCSCFCPARAPCRLARCRRRRIEPPAASVHMSTSLHCTQPMSLPLAGCLHVWSHPPMETTPEGAARPAFKPLDQLSEAEARWSRGRHGSFT